jgi:hypothetical protein
MNDHITELRKQGKFVFTYDIKDTRFQVLSPGEKQAVLRTNFQRTVDSYLSGPKPPRINTDQSTEFY